MAVVVGFLFGLEHFLQKKNRERYAVAGGQRLKFLDAVRSRPCIQLGMKEEVR